MNDGYIIRRAGPDDAAGIHEVEINCFVTPWSRESIEEDLKGNPKAVYLVAEVSEDQDKGRSMEQDPEPGHAAVPAGYMSAWMIGDECHINNVAVMPDERRKGLGGMLIDAMLDEKAEGDITAYTLEVRADNDAAIGLYEKYGFREEGRRPGYYQEDGMDAIIMWRRRGI